MRHRSAPRRAWLLLFAGALAAAAMFGAMTLTGGAAETRADTTLDTEEQSFMVLLNDYRAQNGLGPMIIDPSLQNASDWMSADMGAKNYFDHNDSLGRTPWARMCDFGYCYNTWKGENIAAGYSTGAAVFEGWRASPGHNSNMLGTHYVVMGLARVNTPGSKYGWYWTNDFGGFQAAPSPPPAPTNTPSPTIPVTQSPASTPSPSPTQQPTASPIPSPAPTTPLATPTPTATATPTPRSTARADEAAADANCDARVTGLDTLAVLLFLTSLHDGAANCPIGGSTTQGITGTPSRGDVDCSGTITGSDALRILRYTSGESTAILGAC